MHHHWHKPIAETKEYAYFECACGSRQVGVRVRSRRLSPVDSEWLAGADRRPR